MTPCGSDWSRPDEIVGLRRALAGFARGCLEAIAAEPAAGLPAQRAMVATCQTIIGLLTALENGDHVAKAAFRILVGQVQGALAAAYYHASRLDEASAATGLPRLRSALAESFERLGRLCEERLGSSPSIASASASPTRGLGAGRDSSNP
jgi:predicted NBD/HSP70 family sugar kinase